MRHPKLLQASPTSETSKDPIGRFSIMIMSYRVFETIPLGFPNQPFVGAAGAKAERRRMRARSYRIESHTRGPALPVGFYRRVSRFANAALRTCTERFVERAPSGIAVLFDARA